MSAEIKRALFLMEVMDKWHNCTCHVGFLMLTFRIRQKLPLRYEKHKKIVGQGHRRDFIAVKRQFLLEVDRSLQGPLLLLNSTGRTPEEKEKRG